MSKTVVGLKDLIRILEDVSDDVGELEVKVYKHGIEIDSYIIDTGLDPIDEEERILPYSIGDDDDDDLYY